MRRELTDSNHAIGITEHLYNSKLWRYEVFQSLPFNILTIIDFHQTPGRSLDSTPIFAVNPLYSIQIDHEIAEEC